ncbi:hypothetical protein AAFF_G00249030 [Aldrovandia affinis]|uniref:Uncharacterized protein n=1 Tax=Aldrovandia affinis TaxID=143900 RepID=A0AAD7RD80_9TELE|nr:hypothetical protein AAFF_G00249030 [Aldrovandia affinis]
MGRVISYHHCFNIYTTLTKLHLAGNAFHSLCRRRGSPQRQVAPHQSQPTRDSLPRRRPLRRPGALFRDARPVTSTPLPSHDTIVPVALTGSPPKTGTGHTGEHLKVFHPESRLLRIPTSSQ